MDDRIALVSDVDGTLLGDDEALEALAAWLAPRRKDFLLAYASGRFFASVVDSIQQTALPEPDVIIGGVGTEMRRFGDGSHIAAWREQFAHRYDADQVRRALRDVAGLERQNEAWQSAFKQSYFLRDATAEQLATIGEALSRVGVDARLVYSSNRDLDVLPAEVDKGSAAEFLARHWSIPARRVIASGDSGNDLALLSNGFRGIVVGNALPELRQSAPRETYWAVGRFAAGVLEGWQYWLSEMGSAEDDALQSSSVD